MNYLKRIFLVMGVLVHVIAAIQFGYLADSYAITNENQHHRIVKRSSKNEDRSIGFKKGNKKNKSSKRNYPWDSSAAEGKVELHFPESVQKHIAKDEEQFDADYYDDYDFEFAKGMVKNGNWEEKMRKMQEKMQDGN